MDLKSSRGLQQFRENVGLKFRLYNSLFTSLPFNLEKTGIRLSLLLLECEEGYESKNSPSEIIDHFFQRYTNFGNDEKGKNDLLFRFVQYVERQVVLFDALEDAAYSHIHDMHGAGTLKHLVSEVQQRDAQKELKEKLKDFSIRLVLTAHPTQFYPGSVLGIIKDITSAVIANNSDEINSYLKQLGKTPFYRETKPTPEDEARSLTWYLENIFYQAAGEIISDLKEHFPDIIQDSNPVITMGFWPGGDRDGNPNVTYKTTLKVANMLRSSITRNYYRDVRRLKRRLSFKKVDKILFDLEVKLYNNLFISYGDEAHTKETPSNGLLTPESILEELNKVREIIINEHDRLFLSLLDNLINKVHVFGLHFASLDIRQESSVHHKVLEAIAEREYLLPKDYAQLSPEKKMEALVREASGTADPGKYSDDALIEDTIRCIGDVKTIQKRNGEIGCNRYIISQCNSALNVLEVYGLFLLNGWKKEELTIDIVPLFETIDDLRHAAGIMKTLYENEVYRQHLEQRGNCQTIMVGFSDGTKDGGYLMANWSIYKAKEDLTRISRDYGIDVIFFDGRGGPPARGGGKTHKFYASMGKGISNKQIQLTIQGQTVSSNFGIIDSARFNIEQLLNAGITNDLFLHKEKEKVLESSDKSLLQELAEESMKAYMALKEHPCFLSYLENLSPLKFYSDTNIGSRPAKRGTTSGLSLKDLRAIPFVGSWSQIKQNVPGYYGVGTAIQALADKGKLEEVKRLYKTSLFFKALMDNCEMAMRKSYFPLTEHLSTHPQYGEMWNMIHDEYMRTIRTIYMLSGRNYELANKKELMADYPVDQESIDMRERIILPITTIQQYAMARIREIEEGKVSGDLVTLKKLVWRCSFGIINAGRNSA